MLFLTKKILRRIWPYAGPVLFKANRDLTSLLKAEAKLSPPKKLARLRWQNRIGLSGYRRGAG
jgi:hypothetical protein